MLYVSISIRIYRARTLVSSEIVLKSSAASRFSNEATGVQFVPSKLTETLIFFAKMFIFGLYCS